MLKSKATFVGDPEEQLRVAGELAAHRLEVHLGNWVSGHHIHSHIVCPLLPYFELRAGMMARKDSKPQDVERRARLRSRTRTGHSFVDGQIFVALAKSL